MVKRGENIYKRRDGRWEGRYIKARRSDGSIHYGYLYSKNYTELKQNLLMMKAIHYKQYSQVQTKYQGTVVQWSQQWLSDVRKRVKHSTYVSYLNKLNLHVLPYLGHMALNKVSIEDIVNWMKKLETKLSINSTRTIFQITKSFFEDATKANLLSQNPCRGVIPSKRVNRKVQALTKKEQIRMYRCALKDSNGLAIILALDLGLRIGEIAGLKWSDIDFSTKLITIKRTAQRLQSFDPKKYKKTMLMESLPKSRASERIIPLSHMLLVLLKKRKESSKGEYIFQGSKPCDPRLISYWFKKICKKGKIPCTHFHVLRHSFATRCIEKGVTIATISSLLGHSSIKMTLDTYITSFLSEKRKAIQLISTKI